MKLPDEAHIGRNIEKANSNPVPLLTKSEDVIWVIARGAPLRSEHGAFGEYLAYIPAHRLPGSIEAIIRLLLPSLHFTPTEASLTSVLGVFYLFDNDNSITFVY